MFYKVHFMSKYTESSFFFYVIWGRSIIYAAVPQNCDTQKNTAGWDSKRLSMGLLITSRVEYSSDSVKTKEEGNDNKNNGSKLNWIWFVINGHNK